MHRLAWLLLALCIAAAGMFIVATVPALPERVASHFGVNNAANGFMTRTGYLEFMLFFALAFPLLLAAAIGLFPRLAPNMVNLPNRDHWLDQGRREATLATLSAHGAWLGIICALFVAAIHYVVLVANRSLPPSLPADLFWMLLVGFGIAIGLWMAALYQRFRVVR